MPAAPKRRRRIHSAPSRLSGRAAGPLTAWRRGERCLRVGRDRWVRCAEGVLVIPKFERQHYSGTRRASGPTDGVSLGNRQHFCSVLPRASSPVSVVKNRFLTDRGDAKKPHDFARKITIRAPLNHARNHQICVKRLTARVPRSVVFSLQNCRFHTSLNFSQRNRCASIPRVLSAPAPGVTP